MALYLYPCVVASEVESHGKVPVWFSVEESTHGPSGIHSEEISEQRTTGAKAVTSDERPETSGLNFNLNRGRAIDAGRSSDFVELSIPCGSQINELYELEVP